MNNTTGGSKMSEWFVFVMIAAGLVFGAAGWFFFRKMPTTWLLDYSETEISQALLEQQQLAIWPHLVLLMVSDAVIFALGWYFVGPGLHLAAVLLAAQSLLLIIVADLKTRIIPDQFTLALLPCAVLLWAADALTGEAAWLPGLLYRFLGGLVAGAVLFFAGWLGEKIMKREAMGMGDVKLLSACGLLCGLRLLPMLILLAFFSAALVAIPLLLRRRRHPDSSGDMAFGPYIALATLAVLILNQPLFRLWDAYLGLIT
jgi:prepilin signal peptidase PulO-like enzyme (type II secretory pathway)